MAVRKRFFKYSESGSELPHRLKVKADMEFKPEEYIRYFEDLNFLANAEIVFMG